MMSPNTGRNRAKRGNRRMAHRLLTGLAASFCLAACAAAPVIPPHKGDLSDALIHLTRPGPPPGPEGACWASDITPAVIETVTEQVLTTPEVRDAAGNVTSPASYSTVSHLRMLQDREEVWFLIPCPEATTTDFIATLQRALKARGLYLEPLTGVMDAATKAAVRRYQASRGFDSPVLTLAATRELGIVATDVSAL